MRWASRFPEVLGGKRPAAFVASATWIIHAALTRVDGLYRVYAQHVFHNSVRFSSSWLGGIRQPTELKIADRLCLQSI